ncbi:major histocompatibility complex class I-related gene protein-like [Stegostoma tigrinum]|uniref:major histocompatibility complex class I-related gene protein-like n=1 Tax=Stegostoma tigrinum TaxID=3053191 RepID=UPI002870101B|nr:major histocompatibility complex class I-related gene protein-like [Stegostoma tigrinum]
MSNAMDHEMSWQWQIHLLMKVLETKIMDVSKKELDVFLRAKRRKQEQNFHVLTFYYLLNLGQAELPEYSLLAMLDDYHIIYFDSTLELCVPRQHWLAQSFPKDHWVMMTITMAGLHGLVKGNIEIFYQQHHGGSGLFFVQGMCGCELHTDNSTDGFIKLGYDGQDAFAFNKDRMSWIAFNPEFQALADRLNFHTFLNKYFKTLLEKDCVKQLLTYLKCGQAALQRTGMVQDQALDENCASAMFSPEVFIGSRTDGERALSLSCLVMGFYPGDIEVTWLRNGLVVLDVESTDLLPYQDTTYWVMKTFKLSQDDGERYSCHIEHTSLIQELDVPWERTLHGAIKLGTMTGASAISLTLLGIITGVGFWRKRQIGQSNRDQQM